MCRRPCFVLPELPLSSPPHDPNEDYAMTPKYTVTLAICAACGIGTALGLARPSPAPPTPAPQTAAAAITVADFGYGAGVTVAPGAVVAVSNVDPAPHTVTGQGFDTGTIAANAAGSFVAPTQAGTYAFICTIHPSMSGTITVTG